MVGVMAMMRTPLVVLVFALSLTARAETEVAPPSPIEMPEIAFPEGAVAKGAVTDVEALLTIGA